MLTAINIFNKIVIIYHFIYYRLIGFRELRIKKRKCLSGQSLQKITQKSLCKIFITKIITR
jgi:hypothetical protein